MIVLSLFDGISCGQIAFERLGITFDGVKNKYIASEIKKIAIETTQLHYPNTIQVGDVCKLHYDNATNALYKNCDCIDNKYYPFKFSKYSLPFSVKVYVGYSPSQHCSNKPSAYLMSLRSNVCSASTNSPFSYIFSFIVISMVLVGMDIIISLYSPS